MPFIAAPGVGQFILSGTIGAQPWATILHLGFPGDISPWSLTQLQGVCSAIQTNWGSNVTRVTSTNVSLSKVDSVDLTNATPAAFTAVFAAIPGAAGTALEPSSMCMVIQYKIVSRYRGGHPRGYWPWQNSTLMLNESTWSVTGINSAHTSIESLITAATGAGVTAGRDAVEQVIPRYSYAYTDVPGKHKYTKERVGYVGTFAVATRVIRPTVGSQRRRLVN